MNLSKLIKNSWVFLVFLLPFNMEAQNEIIKLVSGTTFSHQFISNPMGPSVYGIKHGTHTIKKLSGVTYEVKYTPYDAYLGYDTIQIGYWASPGNYKFDRIILEVVPSIILVEPDYISTSVNSPVIIDVLQNDSGTHGNLQVTSIPLCENGVASTIAPNFVYFNPEPNFSGITYLNYIVCDQEGTCETGTVTINVIDPNPPVALDTITIQTKSNTALVIPLNYEGYTLDQTASNGDLSFINSFLIEYLPNEDFIGWDDFTLTKDFNGVPTYITFEIDVLATEPVNEVAFDDHAFTPINTEITIDVTANDLGNYWVGYVGSSNQGTTQKIDKDHIKFVPNTDFEGVAVFTYSLKGMSGTIEYAKVYVHVENQNPSQDTYEFITSMNTPKILYYNTPLSQYNFSITSSPDNGTIEVLNGEVDTLILGQSIKGNDLVIYTPNIDYVGLDEFEVLYCLSSNGACSNTKIIMDVIDTGIDPMNSCISNDCVWPGDGNNDGVVNMLDLLQLGLNMGSVGESRPSASLSWIGQTAQDWNKSYGSVLIDSKHADADGDGYVEASDIMGIDSCYGLTHTMSPKYNPYNKDYPIYLELQNPQPSYEEGDTLRFSVLLGKANDPAIDIYGFTFTFDFDPQLFDANSLEVHYAEDNWLKRNSPLIALDKQKSVGKVDLGMTRTTGFATSGYGTVCDITIIIEEDVIGIRPGSRSKKIEKSQVALTNIGDFKSNGDMFTSDNVVTEVLINLDNKKMELNLGEDTFITYPNPVKNILKIENKDVHLIKNIRIFEVSGREMYNSGKISVEEWEIDMSDFKAGVYLLEGVSSDQVFSKKINVVD